MKVKGKRKKSEITEKKEKLYKLYTEWVDDNGEFGAGIRVIFIKYYFQHNFVIHF